MTNIKKSGMYICLATLLLCMRLSGQVHAAAFSDAQATQDMNMEPAQDADIRTIRPEAGVIEIRSGFVDTKGTFWIMKSGSGFLIANKESATYMITNSSIVSNTPQQIKKFCKKHKIDTENMQLTNAIRVVITGDVMAEAEVVVKSAEKDYCVLSAANVVSQKESLKLGDSTGIAVNDLVYAYGFPEQAGTQESTLEYSEPDVRSMQGAVVQTQAYLNNGIYLSHSAPVVQGLEGGPLLDADGYVIGLNCKQSPEDDSGVAYALPINEISAVLDNFSIYYGSRAIDETDALLKTVYQECMDIQAAGGFKKESAETLEQALESAQELMQKEEPSAAELAAMTQMLTEGKNMLEPKTATLTIAVFVLGVIDLLLFIWMLVLAVKNAQEKKEMEMRKMQSAAPYAGVRSHPQQSADQYGRPVAPPAGRRLHMIRQKTGQTIVLNKNQFILGKSQAQADFCMADNQTISRKHALLFEDHGGWYVDDLNSLNGTCVNGKKIVPGQPVRLNSGDQITLSDEIFLVRD